MTPFRSARLWALCVLVPVAAAAAGAPSRTPVGAQPPLAPSSPLAPAGIEAAAPPSAPSPPKAPAPEGEASPDPLLIKEEVLLARARFSPGEIDGRDGDNLRKAIWAFEAARKLPKADALDPHGFSVLTAEDKGPVLQPYVIAPADVAGPFTPELGESFVKMAHQSAMNYPDPRALLAARFHMAPALLDALNPGADYRRPGVRLVVVAADGPPLPPAAKILVDRRTQTVTALDGQGGVLAVYPATVGSRTRPSPRGRFKVKGVAQNPDYIYDPRKLTWGPRAHGKLRIPPGPKGPVGVVWIALTAPDYGIHGTPDPHLIGKSSSHGCVRLTNWDAETLSHAVKPGVPVDFIG